MNRTTLSIIPLSLALALPLSAHASAPRHGAADGSHMVGVTTIHTATKPVPWPVTCGDFTTDATSGRSPRLSTMWMATAR